MQSKGIWQKALLSAMVKKHCAVSNEWIANRLAMGHPANLIKVETVSRQQGRRKKMTGYEKILRSKD
jgi:hypothetical protein